MARQSTIRIPDRRLAAAGLLLGAAVGTWAGGRARAYASREQATGLIDWERARIIAVNMNKGQALSAGERTRLDAYYRQLVGRCVPVEIGRASCRERG